ncbi:conserved membrane protein of unknown function [Xenorhabdus poinarii G6]|uniref:TPM domain-containing protein n=1 Tax=Xenorhabdus poinarii G6 TaxID=1354304 RepID=A0A068R7X8_9GAMM|nr:conserved membrane protein of unknown function [Xenorhabdus poinarii G6]
MLVVSHRPKSGCCDGMTQSRITPAFIIRFFLVLFLLLSGIGNVSAGEKIKQETTVIDVPALSKRVTDLATILTKQEKQGLTRQLKKLQAEKKVQMAVLILPTTGSDTVEEFASRVFDKWKLGSKEKDRHDGILFLIAVDDHKMRIAVGSGLEGQLTDGKVSGILRKEVKPAFKEMAYYEGISNAIDAVGTLLGQAETQTELSRVAKAVEENSAFDNISDKVSEESLVAPFGFCLVSMLCLPWLVFRTGHWFKRYLKCVLTTSVATYVLSLVGIFPPIPLAFYLLIFLLPVILICLVLFSVLSLLKSLFSNLFGGLFGGSGSGADSPKSDDNDDDDGNFLGGGGRSNGGGASSDW